MKTTKWLKESVLVVSLSMFLLGSASATQPGQTVNPNGFPSGQHFNLNIIGKKGNFACPPQEYYWLVTVDVNDDGDLGQLVEGCDAGDECVPTDTPIYGNVIFVPREQGMDPISILMESGRKGPKSAPAASTLEVIDWCSESFPDDGGAAPPLGDPAVLRLPKNDNGYAVYARITGKPGDNETERTFNIVPELALVQDETGNDLILLGLVSPDGVFNSDGVLLKRTSDSSKGKGVQRATDITGLFEWSGEVCYVQADSDLYCLADDGTNLCSTRSLCCVDAEMDGVYESCDRLTDVGIDPDGDGNFECPETDVNGNLYIPVDAQCKSYDNAWVFNIGDFVDVLWKLDTTGAYVVQIRFYPQ